MGRTDLAVFELIKRGAAIFEATSQFAALDLLLAGVLVESAFRHPKIFSSLSVCQPKILGLLLERKTCCIWRRGPNLVGNACQRLA